MPGASPHHAWPDNWLSAAGLPCGGPCFPSRHCCRPAGSIFNIDIRKSQSRKTKQIRRAGRVGSLQDSTGNWPVLGKCRKKITALLFCTAKSPLLLRPADPPQTRRLGSRTLIPRSGTCPENIRSQHATSPDCARHGVVGHLTHPRICRLVLHAETSLVPVPLRGPPAASDRAGASGDAGV